MRNTHSGKGIPGPSLRLLLVTLKPSNVPDAYGFHVRNCTVRDMVSGVEYLVIDEQGYVLNQIYYAYSGAPRASFPTSKYQISIGISKFIQLC